MRIIYQTPMRVPRNRQSRFLHPLDEILGTQANVRLLRVLVLRRSSLTAGELARAAALGRTSIYPVLRQLERAGIVEFVGAGAQRLVQLRDRHPLSRILKDLFRFESRRFEALTIALRDLLADPTHRLISVWIDEPTDDAQSAETLRLYIVARPEELGPLTDHLNAHLAEVEREYDIHIAIQEFTRSELVTRHTTGSVNLNSVALLAGVPPLALVDQSRPQAHDATLATHDEHDVRSRKLALAVAAKIKRDPGLIAIAEDHVKVRSQKASAGERRELAEWARILATMSPARLQRFLVENSERAIRLRQTLLALRLLSPAEREAVLRSRTDADVVAAVTK